MFPLHTSPGSQNQSAYCAVVPVIPLVLGYKKQKHTPHQSFTSCLPSFWSISDPKYFISQDPGRALSPDCRDHVLVLFHFLPIFLPASPNCFKDKSFHLSPKLHSWMFATANMPLSYVLPTCQGDTDSSPQDIFYASHLSAGAPASTCWQNP